jgi:hypothetical protein
VDWLAEIWPFAPGQQRSIFYVTGLAIFGLIALNLYSALRQQLPLQKVIGAFFSEIGTTNRVEKCIRVLLIGWLLVGFLVLVLDAQINGMQLVDPNWHKDG